MSNHLRTKRRLAWKNKVNKRRIRSLVLKLSGGCRVQHGWPCGSCFFSGQPNTFTDDEWGRMWHAVLALRGDYDEYFMTPDGEPGYHMVKNIEFDKDGKFKRHVYEFEPVTMYIDLFAKLSQSEE